MSSLPWDYIAKLVCIGDSGCGKSSLTIRLCEGRFSAQHDVTIGVEFGSRIMAVGPPHNKSGSGSVFAAVNGSLGLGSQSHGNNNNNSNNDNNKNNPSSNPGAPTTNTASSTATTTPTPGGLPEPRRKEGPPPPQKHMKLSLWDTAGQETYKSVTRSYFRGASGALLVFDITRRATFLHATDWLNDLRQIAEPDIVVVLVGNKLDEVMPGGGGGGGSEDRREVAAAEARDWARRNGVLAYVETSAKSGENVEAAFAGVAERIFENINAGRYDLNDRRSGVKGPGPGPGGGAAGATGRTVRLSADAGRGVGGGCC